MNIWSLKKKGQFKIWAKILSLFLAFCLCVTLNPIGKNAKAWASTSFDDSAQEQTDYETNYEDNVDEQVINDQESYDTEGGEQTSYDEISYDSEDYEQYIENQDETQFSDLQDYDSSGFVSAVLCDEDEASDQTAESFYTTEPDSSETSSDWDKGSNSSLEDDSLLDDYDYLNSLSDDELLQLMEAYTSGDIESDGSTSDSSSSTSSFLSATPSVGSYFTELTPKSGDDVTDESGKYEQYSIGATGTEQLGEYKTIDCTYSYEVNDDQSGVYITGFTYVNESDYKISNDDEKQDDTQKKDQKTRTLKTLAIPAKLTLKPIEKSSSSKFELPVLGIKLQKSDTSEDGGAFRDQQFFEQIYFAGDSNNSLAYWQYLDIAHNSFDNCIAVEKVVSYRDTLLGKQCFANCELLQNAYFEDNVAQIQDEVFENCINLNWVFWGNAKTNQFSQVKEEFQIKDDFYTFGSNVFNGCSKLEKICIPQNIKYVSDEALCGCSSLVEAVFPANAQTLGKNIFTSSDANDTLKLNKAVFVGGDTKFSSEAFNYKTNGAYPADFKVYSLEGSAIMNECNDYKIPFSMDAQTTFEALNLYKQTQEDVGQEVTVENDRRGHTGASYTQGDGSSERPYLIYNFKDLCNFANVVNLGQKDACAKLMADIVVSKDEEGNPISNNNWTPIANNGDGWSGTFDGNNYTIDGLTQTTLTSNSFIKAMMWTDIGTEIGVGIIGSAIAGAMIGKYLGPWGAAISAFLLTAGTMIAGFFIRNSWRRFTYPGGFIQKTSGNYNIHDVDFTNCNFNVQSNSLGGLISHSYGEGKISNVTIGGEINALDTWTNAYYGGFIGTIPSGNVTFDNCINTANVTGNTYYTRQGGGFVGKIDATCDFNNCSNQGTVLANGADTGEIVMDVINIAIFATIDALVAAYGANNLIKEQQLARNGKSFQNEVCKRNGITLEASSSESNKNLDKLVDHYSKWNGLDSQHSPDEVYWGAVPNDGTYFKTTLENGGSIENTEFEVIIEDWAKKNNINDFKTFSDWKTLTRGDTPEGLEQLTKLKESIKNAPESVKNAWQQIANTAKHNCLNQQIEASKMIVRDYNATVVENWVEAGAPMNDIPKTFNESYMTAADWDELAKSTVSNKYFTRQWTSESGTFYEDALNLDYDYPWNAGKYHYLKSKFGDEAYFDVRIGKQGNLYSESYNKYYEIVKNRNIDAWNASPFGFGGKINPGEVPTVIPTYSSFQGYMIPISNKSLGAGSPFTILFDRDAKKYFLQIFNPDNTITKTPFFSREASELLRDNRFNTLSQFIDGCVDAGGNVINAPEMNQFISKLDDLRSNIFNCYDGATLAKKYKITGYGEGSLSDPRSATLCFYREVGLITNERAGSQVFFAPWTAMIRSTTQADTQAVVNIFLFAWLQKEFSHFGVNVNGLFALASFRDLIYKNQQREKRNANQHIDSSASENTLVCSSEQASAGTPKTDGYLVPVASSANDSSESLEKYKDMYKDIPKSAVDSDNVNNLSRRSTVMRYTDGQYYLTDAKVALANYRDKYYFNGLTQNSGFGTFDGTGGGFVSVVGSSSHTTFTNCDNEGTVIGGQSAGGFVGLDESKYDLSFDKCTTESNSNVCAVDTGTTVALGDHTGATAGGFIGWQASGTSTQFRGCVSASTQLSKKYTAGYVSNKENGRSTVDYSVSSGYCYTDGNGYCGGFFGDCSNNWSSRAETIISNSYFDGLVAMDGSKKGTLAGAGKAISDNVYYYANDDVIEGSIYAASYVGNTPSYSSSDTVTCMKDTNMLQSGELCASLNDGIGEGVFGQNLGVVPTVVNTAKEGDPENYQIKLENITKSERPLPFMLMPVFKYQQTEVTNADSSKGDNPSVVSASYSSEDNSNINGNVTTQYMNYPTTATMKSSVNFIDIECDDNAICKPGQRVYLNKDSDYTVQMLGVKSHGIKQVLLDDVDITNQLTLNQTTKCYEYKISHVTTNHKIQILTEYRNFDTEPEFVDGYYIIKDINTLSWYKNNYSRLIKEGKTANAKLANDINMSTWHDATGTCWTGIGDEATPYQSKFLGEGFTISNLDSAPLFKVTNNATISDLIIDQAVDTTSALISIARGTTTLKNDKLTNSQKLVDGFIENLTGNFVADGCFVESCSLRNMVGNQNIGCLVGLCTGVDNNNYIKITNCSVRGNLESSQNSQGNKYGTCGGAIGYIQGKYNEVKFDTCNVNVSVIAETSVDFKGGDNGNEGFIGGVIGKAIAKTNNGLLNVNVSNCTIGGSLDNTLTYGAGGIIGSEAKLTLNNLYISFSKISAKTLTFVPAGTMFPESYDRNFAEYLVAHWNDTSFWAENPICNNVYVVDCGAEGVSSPGVRAVIPSIREQFNRVHANFITKAESSLISSGEITYKLSQNCDKFVQMVDDPDISVPSYPSLSLTYKAQGPDFVLRFNGNGADNAISEMTPIFMQKGTEITLPTNIYSRNGYIFTGWATSENGKVEYGDGAKFKVGKKAVMRNQTLYAVWQSVSEDGKKQDDKKMSEVAGSDELNSNGISEESGDAYTDNEELNSDEESNDQIKPIAGKVYQYKRLSSDEIYYSNLTDENSYIVGSEGDDSTFKCTEGRFKVGTTSKTFVTPTLGYVLKDVTYEVKNNDQQAIKQLKPELNFSPESAVASFQNAPSVTHIVLDAKTEVIGSSKPQGSGTESDHYKVSNVNELLYVANCVNSGVDGKGPNGNIYIDLVQNIDMSNVNWVGIGTKDHPFSGYFYGGYTRQDGSVGSYKITGLNNQAVFGYVNSAKISYFDVIGSSYTALVATQAEHSTISNINAFGQVKMNKNKANYAGAIVGNLSNSTMNNCVNYCDVAIENTSSKGDCGHIGGIVGQVSDVAKIEGCTSYGTMIFEGSKSDKQYAMAVGGIVGYIDSQQTVEVIKCVNHSSFKGQDSNVGGIVGAYCLSDYWYWSGSETGARFNFVSCENDSDINGKFFHCGGLIGYMTALGIYQCGEDDLLWHFINCVNNGNISTKNDAGGFVGRSEIRGFLLFKNCTSSATNIISDDGNKGLICGYSELYDCPDPGLEFEKFPGLKFEEFSSCYQISGLTLVGKPNKGLNDDSWKYCFTTSGANYFSSGQAAYELNNHAKSDIVYQRIDAVNEIRDTSPHVVTNDDQTNNFGIHFNSHTYKDGSTQSFYSNYPEDKLCYVDVRKDGNITCSDDNTHFAPGANWSFSVKSINGCYIMSVAIKKVDGSYQEIVEEFLTHGRLFTENNYEHKFNEPGDFTLELDSKYPEAQEPAHDANWIYQVSNAKELQWVSQQYNIHHNHVSFVLVKDIDMTNQLFVPIGTKDDPFTESFSASKNDGTSACYTVKNLNSAQLGLPGGLFGYINTSATVGNVNLTNVNALGGGFAYQVNNGTISNVSVRGIISGFANSEKSCVAGGIAGIASAWASFENCTNYSSVSILNNDNNYNYAGGIVGSLIEGTRDQSKGAQTAKFNLCTNNGKIMSYGASGVAGGIIGSIHVNSTKAAVSQGFNVELTNSTNKGTIGGHDNVVGGLIGCCTSNHETNNSITCNLTVDKCQNIGNVGTLDNECAIVGGAIGKLGSTQEGKTAWTVSVSNTNILGKIVANSKKVSNVSGGIVGLAQYYSALNLTDSYVASSKLISNYPAGKDGLIIGQDLENTRKARQNNSAIKSSGIFATQYKNVNIVGNLGSPAYLKTTIVTDVQVNDGSLCVMLNHDVIGDANSLFKQNFGDGEYSYPSVFGKGVIYRSYLGSGSWKYSNTSYLPRIKGNGTEANPYLVTSGEVLANLYLLSNDGLISNDCHMQVVNDIDLSPFVITENFKTFKGTITGQVDSANGQVSYHSIKVSDVPIFDFCDGAKIVGVKISGAVGSGMSLICNEAQNTEFSSIGFDDAHLGQAADNSCVGLITAAAHDNVNITNCSVGSNCTLTSSAKSGAYGMLVGVIDGKDTTIKSCQTEGKLVADKANQQELYAGGFVGAIEDADNITVEDCINDASVTTSSYNGGFIGAIKHVSDAVFMAHHGTALSGNQEGKISFKNCQNKGIVSGTNSISGGFVGGYLTTTCGETVLLDHAVNSAASVGLNNTQGSYIAGGVFGLIDSVKARARYENSYTVANCYACSSQNGSCAGGFAGQVKNVDAGYRELEGKWTSSFYLRNGYIYTKEVKANYGAGELVGAVDTSKNMEVFQLAYRFFLLSQGGINEEGAGSNKHYWREPWDAEKATLQDFANGKVAYELGWKQTLDKLDTYKTKNEYPVYNNAETVYKSNDKYTNYDPSQIHIKTAQDLVDVQKKYSSYSKYEAKKLTYSLDNDIDMSGINWDNSIGSKNKEFVSTFNGNGHSINNLTGKSLFGNCEGATIQNVAFYNVNCETAPVVSYGVNGTKIISVTTDGTVHAVDGAAGGIAGSMYAGNSIIQDCVSKCDIKVSNVAEVTSLQDELGEDSLNSMYDELGSNNLNDIRPVDTLTSVAAGGIVGECGLTAKIEKCENYGSVNAEGFYLFGSSLGGLIGYVPQMSSGTVITNGYNEGKISGGVQAGGLIGSFGVGSGIIRGDDDVTVSVKNVINNGEVTGASYNSSAFGCIVSSNHVGLTNAKLTSKKISGDNPSVVCSDLNGSITLTDVMTGHHQIADVINNGRGKVNGYVGIMLDQKTEDDINNNYGNDKRSVVNIDFESTDNGNMLVNGVMSTDQNTKSVTVPANSTVTLTFQPDKGMETDVLVINDNVITLDGQKEYKLAVTDQNIKASVFYKENRETTKIQSSNGDVAYNLKSENKTFTKWTSTNNELPSTSGNYYLTSDVNLSGTWVIKRGTNISLSLEGHMIKELVKDVPVIQVEEGASLEIYDLNNGGRLYYFTDNTDSKGNTVGAWKLVGSSATGAKPANVDDNHVVKGGIITGATGNGCGIKVDANGSVIVHQANIVGNEGNSSAGGVDNHGSFDLRHGSIIGNYGTYVGGVVNHTNGTFTNRDEIEYNTGVQDVGGVRNIGQYNVEGFSKLSYNTLAKTKQPADFSIVAAINNTADNQGDKVTILSRVNFVGSVYCLTNCYMSVDDVSLNILGWKLTSNYSVFNKLYYGAVDPFVLDKSGYHLQIKDGELAIVKQ